VIKEKKQMPEKITEGLNKIQTILNYPHESWPFRCSLSAKEIKTIHDLIERIKNEI